MSFEKVMKSAAGRGCFRQFLRTEFSEENMMFWFACEELKKETNKIVVEEKVRQIYEDFISILSPKEVSWCGYSDYSAEMFWKSYCLTLVEQQKNKSSTNENILNVLLRFWGCWSRNKKLI